MIVKAFSKMATIRQNHGHFVCLSGDRFIAFSDGYVVEIQIPATLKEPKDEKNPQSKADDKIVNKNCVLASAFSASGRYCAIGDDHKQLHVYKVSPKWELVSTRQVARRCTAVAFPHNEMDVIVADRTGDVYRYSLADTNSNGKLLLGHLSMILNVVITDDDKYIITCDRDEKVRISCYPNAYNIHAYCLLHTEYVSQIVYLEDFHCLISGSGDGKLAAWSMEGNNLCCTNTRANSSSKCPTLKERTETDMVTDDVVIGEGETEAKGHTVVEGHTEVEGETDYTDEPPGVRRMIYDKQLKIIAVIYYRSKQLNLFTAAEQANGFQLLETTQNALAEEPWDICFDENHRLWVLQPCEHSPVVVYQCLKDDCGQIEVPAYSYESDEFVQNTRKMMCDRWQFFQASVDCQNKFISLHKARTYENVQRYLEKKEERINAQKNKQQPPPQKKLKTS